MGKRLGIVVALLVVVVAVTLSPAAAAFPSKMPALRVAHTPRPRIVDDLGRTVILRGVNLNPLGEYYQEWKDLPTTLPLTEDEFTQIASNGFNVVRLLVTWSRLEPRKGVIDYGYIDRIAQAVGWAKAHGIYTLIDMHQDAWSAFVDTPDNVDCPPGMTQSVGWDGAPAWATSLKGTVATCTAGIREVSAAAQLSFSRFYANDGRMQSHLLTVWGELAKRFKNEPAVAGYDLLNEPNPGMTPGVNDYATLGLYYRRAIKAIRDAGDKHMVFFEPAVITGPLSTPGPVSHFSSDKNLVYAPHLYNESISPLPFGTIEDGFVNAERAGKKYGNTPVFVGEWGWFGDPASDQPRLSRYAQAEDRHMASGTWWQWKQACGDPHAVGVRGHRPSCAGKSIYSDGFVTRSAANKAVLTRAYVRAAPGLLTSISGSATGLKATGVAAKAGEIDVWVPPSCQGPWLWVWQNGDVHINYGASKASISKGTYTVRLTCAH